MADRWLLIDAMISELGGIFALEIEATALPELASDPVLHRVRVAMRDATDAVALVASVRGADGERFEVAREALDAAVAAASAARAAVDRARSERNRSV